MTIDTFCSLYLDTSPIDLDSRSQECKKVNTSVSVWYAAKHYKALQFDSSLSDIDVHSSLQGYRQART